MGSGRPSDDRPRRRHRQGSRRASFPNPALALESLAIFLSCHCEVQAPRFAADDRTAVSGISLGGRIALSQALTRVAAARDLATMKALGMNVVYIGHNNPGDANPNKTEPGLSYAVYYAIGRNTPAKSGAASMLDAVIAALDAAEDVGIDVVLPIGYQVDMGPEWSQRYPASSDETHDGTIYDPYRSGATASPYSQQYRRDIEEYYRWVDATLVRTLWPRSSP